MSSPKTIERNKAWFKEIMSERECDYCGQLSKHLEWHHRKKREPGDISVVYLVGNGNSIARILEEMAKCDVTCPTCHRVEDGNVKLNKKLADEIRRRHTAGESQRALAKEYGIHQTQASNIARFRHWK